MTPSPLAKANRRVRQLERCVDDLGSILDVRARELWGDGAEESAEMKLINRLTGRIRRTLPLPCKPPESSP